MADLNRPADDREAELNRALEAMYYAFRAFIAKPDERLGELSLARVHHRILYFIGRNPGCSVSELLQKLKATKQYINQPLRRLTEEGYVAAVADENDRRIKRLSLTPKGAVLESELSGGQRSQFERVFSEAGPDAEAGWREIMGLLAKEMPE